MSCVRSTEESTATTSHNPSINRIQFDCSASALFVPPFNFSLPTGLKGVEEQFPEVRSQGELCRSYDGSLSMAATVKQTCESTNNKTTQPIGRFLPFFSFQLVWGVVWASPIYRGRRSSRARLGAHPMAVTVKRSH
jgi:hypothetical protein